MKYLENTLPRQSDALEFALDGARISVEPTGARTLVALDVSESMAGGAVDGIPGLTPRELSAAMALVTAATEPWHEIVGFRAAPDGETFARAHLWPGGIRAIGPVAIRAGQRLDAAVASVTGLRAGGVDPALPMLYAIRRELAVDTFVVYTGSEPRVGDVHPADALRSYRRRSGIDARLVVVALRSNGFLRADATDSRILDLAGFDAETPALIAGFATGRL